MKSKEPSLFLSTPSPLFSGLNILHLRLQGQLREQKRRKNARLCSTFLKQFLKQRKIWQALGGKGLSEKNV